jgi:hypothetical protein
MKVSFFGIVFRVLGLAILLFGMPACSDKTSGCIKKGNDDLVTGQNGPRRIYVPAYYLYRNGKYHFVKGHYRLVLNRKVYLARANRGYTTRMDEASAR